MARATTIYDKLNQIDYDRSRVIHKFLDERGWEHTSSTPGCYWMYKKTINGCVFLVGPETALNFEHALDEGIIPKEQEGGGDVGDSDLHSDSGGD